MRQGTGRFKRKAEIASTKTFADQAKAARFQSSIDLDPIISGSIGTLERFFAEIRNFERISLPP